MSNIISRYRDGPRRPLSLAASLWSDEDEHACALVNISLGGAKVQLDTSLEPGVHIKLELPELCTLEGRLAWNKLGCVGIQFSTKPKEVRFGLGARARAIDLDGITGCAGAR